MKLKNHDPLNKVLFLVGKRGIGVGARTLTPARRSVSLQETLKIMPNPLTPAETSGANKERIVMYIIPGGFSLLNPRDPGGPGTRDPNDGPKNQGKFNAHMMMIKVDGVSIYLHLP